MKTKSNEPQKRNLAIPGEPMSESEFILIIKEAENGPFMTGEELKIKMQSWKRKQKGNLLR